MLNNSAPETYFQNHLKARKRYYFIVIKPILLQVKEMNFDVVLEKQEEGGYTAYVPSLPGCISEGNNKAETMKNIRESISLYLEETRKSKLKKLLSNFSIVKTEVKSHA